ATGALTVVKTIDFDAAHGVDAQNGAEQPVWDPGTGKFYLSIPQIGSTPSHGGVLRISTTGTVEATYPVEFCSPAGLALGPKQDLLVGCNTVFDTAGGVWTGNADKDTNSAKPRYVILDAKTGNIDKVLFNVGPGDEVWFNKGDNNYYTASSGSPLAPNAITPARAPLASATTAPTLTAQGAAVRGAIARSRRSSLSRRLGRSSLGPYSRSTSSWPSSRSSFPSASATPCSLPISNHHLGSPGPPGQRPLAIMAPCGIRPPAGSTT